MHSLKDIANYHCLIFSVIDEEDQSITASSIVTVTVTLVRKSMEDFLDKEGMPDLLNDQPEEEQVMPQPIQLEENDEDNDEDNEQDGKEASIFTIFPLFLNPIVCL